MDIQKRSLEAVMEYIQMLWQQILAMRWQDFVDIIVVAFLIYKMLPLLNSTGTKRIVGAVLGVLLVSWITGLLKIHALNFILNQLMAVGLVAVVVLFQPELRRMLDHLGSIKVGRLLGTEKPQQEMIPVIQQTVQACEAMSRERVGALIVFARDSRLDEYFKTGTVVDAQVSDQLLRNIFFPRAALHDGAVIIRDGRVAAAACVLPLSESDRLSAELGTRHRAGVGMSEVSDAVVVIVSEETGAISVAVGGMLKRHLAAQTLERLLRNELCHEEGQEDSLSLKLRQKLQKKEKEEQKK